MVQYQITQKMHPTGEIHLVHWKMHPPSKNFTRYTRVVHCNSVPGGFRLMNGFSGWFYEKLFWCQTLPNNIAGKLTPLHASSFLVLTVFLLFGFIQLLDGIMEILVIVSWNPLNLFFYVSLEIFPGGWVSFTLVFIYGGGLLLSKVVETTPVQMYW